MRKKDFLSSLNKNYSKILLAMFLFAMIFVTIFYLFLYNKIMSPASKNIQNSIEEIDRTKLESVIKSIIDGEKRYLKSFNKKYSDIFK